MTSKNPDNAFAPVNPAISKFLKLLLLMLVTLLICYQQSSDSIPPSIVAFPTQQKADQERTGPINIAANVGALWNTNIPGQLNWIPKYQASKLKNLTSTGREISHHSLFKTSQIGITESAPTKTILTPASKSNTAKRSKLIQTLPDEQQHAIMKAPLFNREGLLQTLK